MRVSFGSWLGFVSSQNGLSPGETQAYQSAKPFLDALETTDVSTCYKMLVLLAMLDMDALPGSTTIDELSGEIVAIGKRDSRANDELGTALIDRQKIQTLLKTNLIENWVTGRGTGGNGYFTFESDRFSFSQNLPESLRGPFQVLAREIVDWRLEEYFGRYKSAQDAEFFLKVSHANQRPILFLPTRETSPTLPEGWTDVSVNGETISINFVRIAANVARRAGSATNILPDILRRWFGEDAGKAGTSFQVLLRLEGATWYLLPLDSNGRVRGQAVA